MSNTQHTPAYLVKYTAIGRPIPSESNPTYNEGYETTEACHIMYGNEDQILEMFAGTDHKNLQIIGPLTQHPSPDLLKERDDYKFAADQNHHQYIEVCKERDKLKVEVESWIKTATTQREMKDSIDQSNTRLIAERDSVQSKLVKAESINAELLEALKQIVDANEDKNGQTAREVITRAEGRG